MCRLCEAYEQAAELVGDELLRRISKVQGEAVTSDTLKSLLIHSASEFLRCLVLYVESKLESVPADADKDEAVELLAELAKRANSNNPMN